MALVGAALFVVAAFAQTDRGSITGTITDPVGAVIANANVVAVESATQAQYTTATTGSGNYTLAEMPAGVYSVSVEVPGFKKFTQQGIRVNVAQVDTIDVKLEVGTAAESITITADAPLLRTESSDQNFNIPISTINDLPLNYALRGPSGQVGQVRNDYSFLDIAPGAYISGQSDIRVNGNPLDSQRTTVDGQENGNWQTGRPDQVEASIDALEEISTQTSNFNAEYGQALGGIYGFEVQAQKRLSWLDATVNYTYLDPQNDTDDRPLDAQPKNNLNFEVWFLPAKGLRAGFFGLYGSKSGGGTPGQLQRPC